MDIDADSQAQSLPCYSRLSFQSTHASQITSINPIPIPHVPIIHTVSIAVINHSPSCAVYILTRLIRRATIELSSPGLILVSFTVATG
jgi:hypothetical protein